MTNNSPEALRKLVAEARRRAFNLGSAPDDSQAGRTRILITRLADALEPLLDASERVGTADSSEWAVRVCQAVAELPDRTSPDDWPEAMMVTHDELYTILMAHGPTCAEEKVIAPLEGGLAARLSELLSSATPGAHYMSGVRQKIDGQEAHGIFAGDIGIASVWYDPKTHAGYADAKLIEALLQAAPVLIDALERAQPPASTGER